MYIVEEIEYKGHTIKIANDEDPQDPRQWSTLGTMVCFHGKYNLGDEHEYKAPEHGGWEELKKAIVKNENVAVILPLYLYDHSGITMNTTGFTSRWDSGQVGFIFVSKYKIKEEFGWDDLSLEHRRDTINSVLVGEVDTYDKYIRGDVYGFIVEGLDENAMDSCWGFYSVEDAAAEAKNVVDCAVRGAGPKAWFNSAV